MRSDEYVEINRKIRVYARSMNQWWKTLQQDKVAEWCFLTAVACSGLNDKGFQRAAFCVALIFFFGKLFDYHDKKKFSRHESLIIRSVKNSELSLGEKQILLVKLERVSRLRKWQSTLFLVARNWRFFLGYSFLFISCIYSFFNFHERVV